MLSLKMPNNHLFPCLAVAILYKDPLLPVNLPLYLCLLLKQTLRYFVILDRLLSTNILRAILGTT